MTFIKNTHDFLLGLVIFYYLSITYMQCVYPAGWHLCVAVKNLRHGQMVCFHLWFCNYWLILLKVLALLPWCWVPLETYFLIFLLCCSSSTTFQLSRTPDSLHLSTLYTNIFMLLEVLGLWKGVQEHTHTQAGFGVHADWLGPYFKSNLYHSQVAHPRVC